MMQRLACAIALTCMLAGLVGPALAEIPADTANLSLSCELQLDDVLALYDERGNITAQNGTVVCDEACKEDCGKKVRNAIYPSKNSDCIRKTKLAACFQVRRWRRGEVRAVRGARLDHAPRPHPQQALAGARQCCRTLW